MTESGNTPFGGGPADLEETLRRQGRRYLALTPLDSHQARICFPGRYRGRPVVWDARLYALDDPRHAALRPRGEFTQYMELGAPDGDRVPIAIGIAVKVIDAAVADRATIMIQKYKRLPDGRHEYGTRLSRF